MGAPRGNRNGMRHERARQAIRTTKLIQKLQKHALGKLEKPMEMSEIRAAEILLRKSVPDLASTSVEILDARTEPRDYTDAELAAIIETDGSPGADEPAPGPRRPDSVH